MDGSAPALILELPLTRPGWRWFFAKEVDHLEMALDGISAVEAEEVLAEFATRRRSDPATRSVDGSPGHRKGIRMSLDQGQLSAEAAEAELAWYSTKERGEDPNGKIIGSFALQLRERLAHWLPELYEDHAGVVLMVSSSFTFNGESMLLSTGRPLVFVSEEAAGSLETLGGIVAAAWVARARKDEDLYGRSVKSLAVQAAGIASGKIELHTYADLLTKQLLGGKYPEACGFYGKIIGQVAGLGVVAHELGHIGLGHLTGGPQRAVKALHREELEADAYAVDALTKMDMEAGARNAYALAALLPSAYWMLTLSLVPQGDVDSDQYPSWGARFSAIHERLIDGREQYGLMLRELCDDALRYAQEGGIVEGMLAEWETWPEVDDEGNHMC